MKTAESDHGVGRHKYARLNGDESRQFQGSQIPMECRFSVKLALRIFFLLVVFFAATLRVARADHIMVLVTSSDSLVTELSALDIRKAYLGLQCRGGGESTVRPLRLNGDLHLNEVYSCRRSLQCRRRSYDRRLLSLTLKVSGVRDQRKSTRQKN